MGLFEKLRFAFRARLFFPAFAFLGMSAFSAGRMFAGDMRITNLWFVTPALIGMALLYVAFDAMMVDRRTANTERTIGMAISRIAELEGRLKQAEPDTNTETKWPWGTHHTEALGHLEAAALRWWKLYDPTESDTAPTNKQVSEWLQTERKVTQKMADSIASILRADGIRPGPR
jgi:hypothetical protein